MAEQFSRCVKRNTSNRSPLPELDLAEMKRLTAKLAANCSGRTFVERNPNDRPGCGPSR